MHRTAFAGPVRRTKSVTAAFHLQHSVLFLGERGKKARRGAILYIKQVCRERPKCSGDKNENEERDEDEEMIRMRRG